MVIPGRTFICVGETGCGKSTFIKAMGGAVPPAEILDDGSSNTTEVSLYLINNEGDSFMDGPGFGDTRRDGDQHSDAEHKMKILMKLTAGRRTHVNGIFWFVSKVRGDESLVDQARFIEGLGALLTPRAIWKHVVVMIRAGIRREGVRKAVKDLTGDQRIVDALQVRVVGLRDHELDPGQSCNVVLSKHEHQIELEKPTVDDVLGFVVSSDPFQVCYLLHGAVACSY
jgi:energy-coupling factor transporter ATP-binding protein EcfA2